MSQKKAKNTSFKLFVLIIGGLFLFLASFLLSFTLSRRAKTSVNTRAYLEDGTVPSYDFFHHTITVEGNITNSSSGDLNDLYIQLVPSKFASDYYSQNYRPYPLNKDNNYSTKKKSFITSTLTSTIIDYDRFDCFLEVRKLEGGGIIYKSETFSCQTEPEVNYKDLDINYNGPDISPYPSINPSPSSPGHLIKEIKLASNVIYNNIPRDYTDTFTNQSYHVDIIKALGVSYRSSLDKSKPWQNYIVEDPPQEMISARYYIDSFSLYVDSDYYNSGEDFYSQAFAIGRISSRKDLGFVCLKNNLQHYAFSNFSLNGDPTLNKLFFAYNVDFYPDVNKWTSCKDNVNIDLLNEVAKLTL